MVGILILGAIASGCIQKGGGGVIINFGNETYSIPTTSAGATTTTSTTYECTKMTLTLRTVKQDYAGFVFENYYFDGGTEIEYPIPQSVPLGKTEAKTMKCGYVVYITVHSIDLSQNVAVISIHTEPSPLSWDGQNIRMNVGDTLTVDFR